VTFYEKKTFILILLKYMSEKEELKSDVVETVTVVEPAIKLEEEKENIKIEEEKKDVIIEEKDITVKTEEIKTFLKLFEIFLTQDESILAEKFTKFDVKLTPEIQKYFLLLCKESPDLFGSFEETLKKIILDDRINSKDISDILVLVSKVYRIIRENKGVPIVDSYELIKILIQLVFIVYIETNKIENSQLLLDLLKIVESSIDLIKLTPIIPKKGWLCFKC
jgi:hypothetical protein